MASILVSTTFTDSLSLICSVMDIVDGVIVIEKYTAEEFIDKYKFDAYSMLSKYYDRSSELPCMRIRTMHLNRLIEQRLHITRCGISL